MKFIWVIQDSYGKHYNWTELYKNVMICGSTAIYIPLEQVRHFKIQNDYIPIVIGGDDYLLLAYENKTLYKGVFNDNTFFRVDNYMAVWKHDYLNWDTKIVPCENLHLEELPFFIRPIQDDKSLDGHVVHTYSEIQNIQLAFNKNSSFCVSTVKAIHKEWRAVIVNGNIVSVCRYAIDLQTSVSIEDVPKKMLEFVKKRISVSNAPLAWVLDVAEYNDKYFVLECNIFNASNFYDCDRKAIILAIEKSLQCN